MSFSRILGHDRQKELLQRAIDTHRLPHAYLFEGPEGIGKRLVALALTKRLFCETGQGCCNCPACRKIEHHNHPDLHLLEPDGQFIKIEQIRGIQKELSFRPLEAPRKVCLIDGAERLNPAAGNALLKTLEEPRPETLLILLSAAPEAVLPTIRSRCQRLPFNRLPRARLQEVLADQLNMEEEEAHILTALADGSFKKALGKDRELFLKRRRQLLKTLAGLSPNSILPLLDLARQMAEDKEHLTEQLEILLAFYRDQLLLHHGRNSDDLVNIDLLELLERMAERHPVAALLHKLEALFAARRQLDRNVNRQLAMEVLLLKLVA
ncbi:DNA polymerase III subunit delta' [Desulfuromonas sp. CSMB_57]|uniref:DNA polymerase III subunit delta' n=1 Tax=Desulfuromonas sp. CSMB_57 TaxID=2807629 RepID=UPI001CD6E9CC